MNTETDSEATRRQMRDALIQQVLAIFKAGGSEALAYQVPDTSILILAGPQDRIQGYLATPIPYGAAGASLRDHVLEEVAVLCDERARMRCAANLIREASEARSLATGIRSKKMGAWSTGACDPAASQIDPCMALPSTPGGQS